MSESALMSNPLVCRYCDRTLTAQEAVLTHGYWSANPAWSCAGCKEAGVKQEAIDCQTIDADCNDCFFFVRGRMLQKGIGSVWEGTCLNEYRAPDWSRLMSRIPLRAVPSGDTVYAFPKFSSNHPCFVHRRSA